MRRRPPRSTLFPYTTHFRSIQIVDSRLESDEEPSKYVLVAFNDPQIGPITERSEEYTSELQSRQYLVCRLLLENKTNLVRIALCQQDRPRPLLLSLHPNISY